MFALKEIPIMLLHGLVIDDEWPALAEVEGRYVARVLAHTRGNKQAAARLLSVDRKTLDRMIKRHDINFNNLAHFPTASRLAVRGLAPLINYPL